MRIRSGKIYIYVRLGLELGHGADSQGDLQRYKGGFESSVRLVSLEGEELGEVIIPDITFDRVEEKFQYNLIGRVHTNRRYHVQTFKHTIRALWGGQDGSPIQILDMGFNLFHIMFNDESKMTRIVQGEPWLFEGYSILLGPWRVGMQADQVVLNTFPCWVQIWNLPLAFVNKEMGLSVGAHIGMVLEVDTRGLEQERDGMLGLKLHWTFPNL
ncbi:hypothetical protein LIER_17980 [Lithospermum erythrorhizon]|uniref:DUF4283 domain-containing protein n=1 Tax=Lithospermum erythrorhizon TaxID=34254 RepID=A0AAV3QGR8_LITER